MKYPTLIRASAVYDLLLTAPLAIPGLAEATIHLLSGINQSRGGVSFAAQTPVGLLFAHLLGSIVTVWSVLRLIKPTWQLGVADTVARALFSFHFARVLLLGAYPIGWALILPEISWGIAQGAGAILHLKNRPKVSCSEATSGKDSA